MFIGLAVLNSFFTCVEYLVGASLVITLVSPISMAIVNPIGNLLGYPNPGAMLGNWDGSLIETSPDTLLGELLGLRFVSKMKFF